MLPTSVALAFKYLNPIQTKSKQQQLLLSSNANVVFLSLITMFAPCNEKRFISFTSSKYISDPCLPNENPL